MLTKKSLVGLIFLLVLGFVSILWASDRNRILQPTSNWMNNPFRNANEQRLPLSPNFPVPKEERKFSLAFTGTGAIKGRVTQAPGGTTPIEGVEINTDKLTCPPAYYASAFSDVDGYYLIEDLPAGKYVVYTSNDSGYLDVYWDNNPSWEEIDTVLVNSNDTTESINFSLRRGGKIAGKVKMSGASSAYITVQATDTLSYNSYSAYVTIDSDSAFYEIIGLPTGVYRVKTYNSDGYIDEYYDNKLTQTNADPVSVTEGSTVSSVDFTLDIGGNITGTVTLPGNTSSFMIVVYASNTTTLNSYSDFSFGTGSSPASYEIKGLPTGTYKVVTTNSSNYLNEYYDNKLDEGSANPVPVTAGVTTPDINFTLGLGGIIKGNVASASKSPLTEMGMYCYSTSSSLWDYSYTQSDLNGNYRFTGLRTGWYKIYVDGDTIYAYEYYDNKSSWISADSIHVTVSDSVTGKNFSLEIGGAISGYVHGEEGSPDADADINAIGTFEYESFRWAGSSSDGSYRLGGLRTGWYKVTAETECNEEMWYNGKFSWEEADSVYVTMPGEVREVNFNFPSAVEDKENQTTSKPDKFKLEQNYPNPFNPGTQIEYTLQRPAQVSLTIYNLLGQKVKVLVSERQSAGSYQITWDGKNEQGRISSSGIYFYRLEVNGVPQTKRMVLLK